MKRFFPIIQCLLFAVVFLAFVSCEKVIEIDDDPSEAQLVLNSVLSPGRQACVYFARTRFFLDPSNDQPVPVQMFELTANGLPLSLDSTVRCRHYFDYAVQEGDSLSVEVVSNGRRAAASTVVPYFPTISDVRIENGSDLNTFRLYRAQFNFQDHAGIREYYNLSVTVRDSGERFNEWTRQLDTVDTVHNIYFTLPNNPGITSSEVSYSHPFVGFYTRNYFHDGLIDGEVTPVDLYILNLRDTNEREGFKHEYTVKLESLTFERLRYLIDASRQGSTSSVFAEQGSVRGNVSGALGLFSGSARCEFTFWPDTLGK